MAVLSAIVIHLLEFRAIQFVPLGRIVLPIERNHFITMVSAIRSQESLLHF